MASPRIILAGLFLLTVSLASQLSVWREQSPHQKTEATSMLDILMGDSQRLFANHFVTKADVYLHSGVYPSFFDQSERAEKTHLAEAAEPSSPVHVEPADPAHHDDETHEHGEEEHDAVSGFLGPPRDWIDSFGRNFYPTKHVHLGEHGSEREVLPWLKLAAKLNPHEVQTYTLGAYWLRNRMHRIKEAEDLLREGWRANPNSYEILAELGRLCEEDRGDLARARNLFEASLRLWQQSEPGKKHPDDFTFMQITAHLARVEERSGNLSKAIDYLEMLRKVSPHPEGIQKQIDELRVPATPKLRAKSA